MSLAIYYHGWNIAINIFQSMSYNGKKIRWRWKSFKSVKKNQRATEESLWGKKVYYILFNNYFKYIKFYDTRLMSLLRLYLPDGDAHTYLFNF